MSWPGMIYDGCLHKCEESNPADSPRKEHYIARIMEARKKNQLSYEAADFS